MLFGSKDLNMFDSKKVIDLQSEFMKRLIHHESPPQYSVPSLLRRISECDEDLLNIAFGNFGQKLRLFTQKVDLEHPEILSVFDGAIADDQDFSKDCMEILSLAKFAKDNNLNRIISALGNITKEALSKNIIKKIDVPSNRMHVRLVKNAIEREEIRMTKRMQIIDLHAVYKKGREAWDCQPDNFTKFLRFDAAYQDDLSIAEKKAQRYEQLGCTSLAGEIRKNIQSFKEHIEQLYYGFNRITMTNAALILAKSHGFEYSQETSVFGQIKLEGKITVPRNFFGSYNFDPHDILEFSSLLSQTANSSYNATQPFNYEPRVYPLHEFYKIASDDVKNTIAILESFPDAGNKPIFDHFGIIVPGISAPFLNDKSSFLDESGVMYSFKSKEDAIKSLDFILIKGKYIYPLIVGDKDGKCYFISYFS
jgi:hypothetical protein